jgi:hypothetical protein
MKSGQMNNSKVFLSACRQSRQADFIMTSFRNEFFLAKMIKFSIKYKNNNKRKKDTANEAIFLVCNGTVIHL